MRKGWNRNRNNCSRSPLWPSWLFARNVQCESVSGNNPSQNLKKTASIRRVGVGRYASGNIPATLASYRTCSIADNPKFNDARPFVESAGIGCLGQSCCPCSVSPSR